MKKPTNRRKLKKHLTSYFWRLEADATRKTISMAELRKILEGERKAQLDYNGFDPESNHARNMLEMVWLIANGYEERHEAQ